MSKCYFACSILLIPVLDERAMHLRMNTNAADFKMCFHVTCLLYADICTGKTAAIAYEE